MNRASLYVRRPSGEVRFIADDCQIADGMVTATGRCKYCSGRLGSLQTFTWPAKRVLEIRWLRDEDAS